MIRLAVMAVAAVAVCVSAVDAAGTVFAAPFGAVAAIAGILLVVFDREKASPPPAHDRLDVEIVWAEGESRIVGYHRKAS